MVDVFLLDDSATLLMSMKSILTKSGFRVESEQSGTAALNRLRSGYKPGLIISDVNMPVMDGFTFVQEAKKLPGMRFVPMLMLTTESSAEKRAQGKAAGAAGWLVKPVNPTQLVAVIKQVVPGA